MDEATSKTDNSVLHEEKLNIRLSSAERDEIPAVIPLPGNGGMALTICSIRFSPPLSNDFLLPRFPLTIALTAISERAELWPHVKFTLETTGPSGDRQHIPLLATFRDDALHRFCATFLPPRPGLYRLHLKLAIASQSVGLLETEAEISQPWPHEPWTMGPMITQVAPFLYIGNAAAAVNPRLYPQDSGGILQAHGIRAVVNAAEERDPHPALWNSGIEYAHFPFPDFSHNPMEEEQLWQAVQWIARHAEQRRSVFVHCHAGIGRSGSLVAAYLLLFRYPEKTFDEVVHQVNMLLKAKGHGIYPHLGLPETIEALRAKQARGPEKCAAPYFRERIGTVRAIVIDSLWIEQPGLRAKALIVTDQTQVVPRQCPIVLRVQVRYEGLPPRGVYLLSNLNGDGPPFQKILMDPVAGEAGMYEARVIPQRTGEDFWLTVCAAPRRYDHDLKAKWIGFDLHFRIVKASSGISQ